MTRFALAAGALGALAGLARFAPAAPEPAPAPRAVTFVAPVPRPAFVAPPLRNTFDVVALANARPVRVRVAVLVEGQAPGARWAARLRAAFEYFDRDGDGYLNGPEAAFVFSDSGVVQLLANGFYQPTPNSAPALAKLDTDGDGRVSASEFVAYYARATALLLSAQPIYPDYTNNAPVTEALFKLFDTNGDGKLTREELRHVEALVASHDGDEDECLNVAELVPGLFDPRLGFARGEQLTRTGRRPVPTDERVAVYPSGAVPGALVQSVLKKYDRDGDFELTPAESGFDAETFARLDTSGDGKLDGEELDLWRTGPPDAALTLSYAAKAADCTATVAHESAVAARGIGVKRVEGGRVVLYVGRQSLDFWSFAPVVGYQQPALKQQYGYLFLQAAGTKGHVTEKDLSGPNAVQFQFVRVMFEAADRDANGKLTRAEFDAYFDLQDGFRNVSLSLSPSVQTPSLFELLDENRDGRLGVRELRTVWDRLLALEEPGADVVTRNVIHPALTIRLTRTLDRFNANQPVQRFDTAGTAVPTKGPLWFRKMDRNGDGDLSHSEFLGTREEFDAMDADRDALVSPNEAEAWDARFRAVAAPKPRAK